jgi:hypothetical protein
MKKRDGRGVSINSLSWVSIYVPPPIKVIINDDEKIVGNNLQTEELKGDFKINCIFLNPLFTAKTFFQSYKQEEI